MNITTETIFKYSINPEYKDKAFMLSYSNQTEIMNEKQRQLLFQKSSACPKSLIPQYEISRENINYENANDEIKRRFSRPDVTKMMSCLGQSALLSGNNESQYRIPYKKEMDLRNYIHEMKKIGDESLYGDVFLVKSGNSSSDATISVAKVSKSKEGEKDLTHELFVGLFGVNELRFKLGVPNFAVVLGGFYCSGPVVDPETDKAVQWCSPYGEKVPYVLYENIANSMSAKEYLIKNLGNTEMCASVLLQLFISIDIASKAIGFTHYDLHYENVLLRPVEGLTQFLIPYVTSGNKEIYIKADSVATIIDYGRSRIEYKNQSYGTYEPGLISFYTYNDRKWPLYDAYKFISFSLFSFYQKTTLTENEIRTITFFEGVWKFFNKYENVKTAVLEQNKTFYSLPYIEETKGYTMVDLINWIISILRELKAGLIASSKPFGSLPVLQTFGDDFKQLDDIINAKIDVPKTLYEYWDMKHTLPQKSIKSWNLIKDKFDYLSAKNEYTDQLGRKTANLNARISELYKIDVNRDYLLYKEEYNRIKTAFSKAYSLTFEYTNISDMLFIGKEIADDKGDQKLSGVIQSISGNIEKIKNKICEYVSELSLIYTNYISEIEITKDIKNNFDWYISGAKRILDLREKFCG